MGTLKNNLRRLRFEKGQMTQQQLAKALGVSRQTIISIEKGKYMPSIMLAIKMARYFGKTVEEIFFIDSEEDQ